MNITIQLPLKAIIIFAYYVRETPTWVDRKLPDVLKTLIGSETNPDALFTITMDSSKLIFLVNKMQAERSSTIKLFHDSLMFNIPTIVGYTGLQDQVLAIAAGNGTEKAAAQEVVDKYVEYRTALEAMYTEMYNKGLEWIND